MSSGFLLRKKTCLTDNAKLPFPASATPGVNDLQGWAEELLRSCPDSPPGRSAWLETAGWIQPG